MVREARFSWDADYPAPENIQRDDWDVEETTPELTSSASCRRTKKVRKDQKQQRTSPHSSQLPSLNPKQSDS